jgi:Domain of unknown function (DUF4386)
MSARRPVPGARVAGAALVIAAIAFMTVFSILAGSFGYPDVLDLPAADVLPRLLALGTNGRAVWAVYALIPLLLIPIGVGAAAVHDDPSSRIVVRVAEWAAGLAGIAMLLGLVRWPTLMWALAEAWPHASAVERVPIAAVFNGANLMFGNFIGEFLGELLLNLSFVLFSIAAWRDRQLPRAVAGFGLASGVLGLIALWRNVTAVVDPIAEVNNLVLPLWLVVWGVALWRRGTAR